MGINLQKGQKIDLSKKGGGALRQLMVGLGWDEAQESKGLLGLFKNKPAPIDCDASVILCGGDGKIISNTAQECCVFYGNLRHVSGAILHQGDNLTGGGEGDDEEIMVNLPAIPQAIEKLVFVVNIYDADKRNQHFGMIKNAFIRLVDARNSNEMCIYNLTENYPNLTAMLFGEVYRYNSEWKFNAIGQGTSDNTIGEFAKRYL